MNETSIFDTIKEYEIRRSLWGTTFLFRRYMDPLWIIVGLVGNLFAFITWIQPPLIRNPSSIYLAVISASDFGFSMCFLIHYFAFSWDILLIHGSVFCHIFLLLFCFTQYFTLPLILTFSSERLLAILKPLSSRYRSTHKRAKIISVSCGGVVLICASINSYIMGYNEITSRCEANPSNTKWMGWQFYLVIVEVLFSGVIPFSTLLINLCVIKNLNSIRENRRIMMTSKNERAFQKKKRCHGSFKATTVVLLAVSMLMICCTLPVGLMYVSQHFFSNVNPYLSMPEVHNDTQWKIFASYQMVKETVDFIGVAHYSCNIFVYLATGSVFKKGLLDLISGRKYIDGRRYVMTSVNPVKGEDETL